MILALVLLIGGLISVSIAAVKGRKNISDVAFALLAGGGAVAITAAIFILTRM